MKKTLYIFFVVCAFCLPSLAQVPGAPSEQDIANIFNAMDEEFFDQSRQGRVIDVSEYFLDTSYETVCGEGIDGKYQQGPVSCFEYVDCVTYLEVVLALAMISSSSLEAFYEEIYRNNIISIKYNGPPSYINRNHFISLDWLPHQQENGLLAELATDYLESVKERSLLISKKEWYAKKSSKEIQCEGLSPRETAQRTKELQQEGFDFKDKVASMLYFPTENLIQDDAKFINQVLDDVGSNVLLVNIIRDDHIDKDIPVIVSHQGLLIRKGGELIFRHASSEKKKVVDENFISYMKNTQTFQKWPVLGCNFQKIL